LTAPVRTDREAARDRVLVAAIVHVNDPQCSEAQMELEDAVADLLRLAGEARRLRLEDAA
jgi:hypothetical protein